MSDANSIAADLRAYFRALVMGDETPPAEGPRVRGLRRSTPQDSDDIEHMQGLSVQAPDPELHGEQFTVLGSGDAGTETGVVLDIIPLESVQVSAQGNTVQIDFVFCDSYPRNLFGPAAGAGPQVTRVVTLPGDPRRDLWVTGCMEMAHEHIGDDLLSVEVDVDWVSGRFEQLQTDELTLPEVVE